MKTSEWIAVAVLAYWLIVPVVWSAKQQLSISPYCMDHIRFTKPCHGVSGSLALCDHVEVAFHCLSAKQGEVGKVQVEQ